MLKLDRHYLLHVLMRQLIEYCCNIDLRLLLDLRWRDEQLWFFITKNVLLLLWPRSCRWRTPPNDAANYPVHHDTIKVARWLALLLLGTTLLTVREDGMAMAVQWQVASWSIPVWIQRSSLFSSSSLDATEELLLLISCCWGEADGMAGCLIGVDCCWTWSLQYATTRLSSSLHIMYDK